MLYLDTSLLVASLTRERKTIRVLEWLGSQEPAELAISDWVATEFSAALSIKLRTRQIDSDGRTEALARFAALCVESLAVLPVSGLHFGIAARFADQHSLGLRAGDALHLAIAADHGATLCTLDRVLSEAGSTLGMSTALL
jgi:predicted nucleic acid-binding protein